MHMVYRIIMKGGKRLTLGGHRKDNVIVNGMDEGGVASLDWLDCRKVY